MNVNTLQEKDSSTFIIYAEIIEVSDLIQEDQTKACKTGISVDFPLFQKALQCPHWSMTLGLRDVAFLPDLRCSSTGFTLCVLRLDWLIEWGLTPYRQYFSHITAVLILEGNVKLQMLSWGVLIVKQRCYQTSNCCAATVMVFDPQAFILWFWILVDSLYFVHHQCSYLNLYNLLSITSTNCFRIFMCGYDVFILRNIKSKIWTSFV